MAVAHRHPQYHVTASEYANASVMGQTVAPWYDWLRLKCRQLVAAGTLTGAHRIGVRRPRSNHDDCDGRGSRVGSRVRVCVRVCAWLHV